MKGKEKKNTQYNSSTLFVDHTTTYIHHQHQVSLRVRETVKEKYNLENFANDNGDIIKCYHADNAPFGARDLQADLELQHQELSISVFGAHHQNGVVERAIQTTTKWSWTMLLDAIINWHHVTAQINVLQLWYFSVDHSIYMWNNTPGNMTCRSPIEIFTSATHPIHDHLPRSHVWGSPIYVLQPQLQDAYKI
jgi:hypothetical protein